jgi:hypothetical protein
LLIIGCFSLMLLKSLFMLNQYHKVKIWKVYILKAGHFWWDSMSWIKNTRGFSNIGFFMLKSWDLEN